MVAKQNLLSMVQGEDLPELMEGQSVACRFTTSKATLLHPTFMAGHLESPRPRGQSAV